MRRVGPWVAAFPLVIAGLAFGTAGLSAAGRKAAPAPPPAEGAIHWLVDRDDAVAEARRDGKPLLIDFWATWCQPCREMEAHLWSRADVLELSRRFVCLRVDVDQDPVTSRRYRSESLPTVIFTDPWGTELARRSGYGSPDMYLDLLRAMPVDYRELAPWQERLAEDPRDLEAMRQAGLAYHRLMLFDTSTEFLDRALAVKEFRSHPDWLGEALTIEGWNHLKLKRYDRARKSFERCLKEAPAHPALDVTLYGLVAVYLVQGNRDKAQPLLAQLESCCPASNFTARARKEFGSPTEGAR